MEVMWKGRKTDKEACHGTTSMATVEVQGKWWKHQQRDVGYGVHDAWVNEEVNELGNGDVGVAWNSDESDGSGTLMMAVVVVVAV